MAFDGIVTKAIASELQQLSGAKIDKILQPNKNTIILGLYYHGNNYALYICIDSQNGRFHLTTHAKTNPYVAPNFCMILRKHLLGMRFKNITTQEVDRVITIEFEGFDDIDDILQKKLVIEILGKHGNIILKEQNNHIIDCLRHIPNVDNMCQSRLPNTVYHYPTSSKISLLTISNFEDFKFHLQLTESTSIDDLPTIISQTYNGISKSTIQAFLQYYSISELNLLDAVKKIYCYLKDILFRIDTLQLGFEKILNFKNKNDYFLIPKDTINRFSLNFFIDDFYEEKENLENFKIYRNSMLKIILEYLHKYKKRIVNIDEKLKECENMELYKLYGELITVNLYHIPSKNLDYIELENYYDNNNFLKIPLNKKYSPSINAKKYFKKYHKLKNTLEIVSIQKQKALQELYYLESIIFEIENCSSIDDIFAVYEEMSEHVVFQDNVHQFNDLKNKNIKKSKLTKNKYSSFNPLKYKIENYTLLIGRNNVENDYLTLKYAKKTDLWFHTKDIHGSHGVLLLNNQQLPDDAILIKCAQIVAFHSKARYSSHVPVDYCFIKYVKKANGAKPGMVIYTNHHTFSVTPENQY